MSYYQKALQEIEKFLAGNKEWTLLYFEVTPIGVVAEITDGDLLLFKIEMDELGKGQARLERFQGGELTLCGEEASFLEAENLSDMVTALMLSKESN